MGVPLSACRGSRVRPLVLLATFLTSLLGPVPALAQTLFGPKQYTLTSSTPRTVSTFVNTSSGPAYLHVTNGLPDGTARLRDAKITLNGLEIVSPEDLGSDTAIIDKPLTLLSTNLLVVTLTGPQNGTLSVTLERRAASLTSVSPASGRQGETLTVTVVGSTTHFVQGSTQLWAGPGVSVGGAPPGELGPVTVQDPTHLTATLTLAPTTVLGPRTLLAKTNGETAALLHGFTLLAGTPALSGTTVTTLAGTGSPGLLDGPGTTAQFRLPFDVAPRADGSALVADTGNSKLRQIAPDGTVTTVALPVSLLLPAGVTVDPSGRTILADTGRCVIRIVNPDNTVTTIGSAFACSFADGPPATARFRFPRDVVADAAGNLYVADTGNFRVRKIDPQGTVTTLAGAGTFGGTDGPGATATFGLLAGLAVTGEGTVLVSDAVFHKIRQITPDGTVSTMAGTGTAGFADGPAATAQFFFPTGLSRDDSGNLYIADTGNTLIRRLTPAGVVETVAGTGARGDQDGPGSAATFTRPLGVGLAPAAPNRIFVADTFAHTIREIQGVQGIPPPTLTALDPTFAVQGDTLLLTVTGTHLTGATAGTFLLNGTPDPAITATGLTVNADGTQLTATVNVALTAALGPRIVTVTTPGGTSSVTASPANTFTVLGRLTLIPTFQQLPQGASGGLTVEITTPAPAAGLAITLTSANPAVATLPPTVTLPAGASSLPTSVVAVGEGSTTLSASAPGYATATAAVTVLLPPPTISSFTPSSGPVGTPVTLTGTHFVNVTAVTFNGVPAPFTVEGPQTITTTVPPGARTGPIRVTTTTGFADSATAFTVTVPLTLAITTPADGVTINQDRVTVRGTVTAPGAPEIGVVVNGVLAFVSGEQWAAEVPLAQGSNVITATARDPQGNTATASITVQTVEPRAPLLVLRASPTSGLAPLPVQFTVESGLSRPIVQFAFDADGDGTVDRTSATFENVTVTYPGRGLFPPALTVTDDQGQTVTAQALVQVLDRAELDALLQAKWTGLKDALRRGDIAGALSSIAVRSRARYQAAFTVLTPDLPTIDSILTNLTFVRVRGREAIFEMLRTDAGVLKSFEIRFSVDEDGIWRLRMF